MKNTGQSKYRDRYYDSVIAVCQLIVQFSIEKQYPKLVYQIETFFSEENWLIFVEFKGKDA